MRSFLNISVACMSLAATLSLPIAALRRTRPHRQSRRPRAIPIDLRGRPTPDRVEQRIADLHARLHITPDEQALWDKFAQVMRDNAQHMRQTADDRAAKIKTMNASENMQSYAQIAMQHAQDVQNLASAFQPLYASLSLDQQRTADVMFRDVGMPHRRSGHRH